MRNRDFVDIDFEYRYGFRMRPNTYPKALYGGKLFMDADTPFIGMQLSFMIEGRDDETDAVLDAYKLQLNGLEQIKPPFRFQPGERVFLALLRSKKLPKLRKRADGGEGIDLYISIHGVKRWLTSSALSDSVNHKPAGVDQKEK